MKRRIVFLLSLLIIALCLPIATVYATQEEVYNQSVNRGESSARISGDNIEKTSADNTDYCVNLLGCNAPGIPSNYVVGNNLCFRPYMPNGDQAADLVNFYNTYCDGNNRKYGSYVLGRGVNGDDFYLKKSLSSSSVSSSMTFSLRWNP